MATRAIQRAWCLVVAVALPSNGVAETLTMSTSFPSPAGIYNAIVTTGNGLGNNNSVLNRNGGYTVLVPPPNNAVVGQAPGRVVIGSAVPFGDTMLTVTSPTSGAGQNQLRLRQAGTTGLVIAQYDTVGNTDINVQDNASLRFLTNNTPRMWIDNSGNMGVGAYSTSYKFMSESWGGQWAGGFYANNYHGLIAQSQMTSGGYHGVVAYTLDSTGAGLLAQNLFGAQYYGYVGLGLGYTIYGNGLGYLAGTTYPSDRRLKEDIRPIRGALGKVLALQPVSFHWKKNTDQFPLFPGEDYGFISQDVEPVIPGLVRDVPGLRTPNGKETLNTTLGTFKTLDYPRFIPFVTGAVQELHAEMAETRGRQQEEIDVLRKENAALLGQVATLEERVQRLETRGVAPTDARRPAD